ncbi:UDP-glucosyltransferase 2-like [Aricia agestis]|uniref:UDP-glucosyltransferase 2-like n=1 Tax=Aricia agestis TaxID=91739 RepID=UPI001C2064EE|nr:UDP-glucosyltransferase 2-like [Aricia agestis]
METLGLRSECASVDMLVRILYALAVCVCAAHAANILAVFPTNTRSHYAMYGRLVNALAKREHNLTVITHFPMKNPPTNVQEISLAGSIPEIMNNLTDIRNAHKYTLKPAYIRNLESIIRECVHACNVVAQKEAVRRLLETRTKFDLVMVEVFGTDCLLPLGERFDAPVVGLLSSVPLPWVNEQLGNPDGTAYIPAYMMGFGQRMTIWERFANTVAVMWAKFLYKYKSQIPSQAIADRLFGDAPRLDSLARNYSLVLSNSHFSINDVRPLGPSLVEVGGLHLPEVQKLPEELKQFLDRSTEGVVYWTFGSMSRIETIPREKLLVIFSAISELSYPVLVKMDRKLLPHNMTLPANMHMMEWIPQYGTLCHPNVKLFITHGGLLGTQEAVSCGVPMLMVPLYADQALNARAMADRGVAHTVQLYDSNIDDWRYAFNELLSNRRYYENSLKLKEKFLDRPVPPLEAGVYWIEYVIRHKGAQHLRSPALDLSYTQYFLLDIIAISLVITYATIYILHKLFRYLCTRCIRWPKAFGLEKQLGSNKRLFSVFWIFKIKTS